MHAKTTENLNESVDRYVQDVLDDVRNGDVAQPLIARAYLMVAANIIGMIRDEKGAELVRRRASAACAPPDPITLDA